jgi:ABC-type sulfate/molybdate transport systems ATPase subunit
VLVDTFALSHKAESTLRHLRRVQLMETGNVQVTTHPRALLSDPPLHDAPAARMA